MTYKVVADLFFEERGEESNTTVGQLPRGSVVTKVKQEHGSSVFQMRSGECIEIVDGIWEKYLRLVS